MEEEELHEALRRKGYEPTDGETGTGVYWHNPETDRLIQVPHSQGNGKYPDWLLDEIERQVGPLI